jgi:hypothetical protein
MGLMADLGGGPVGVDTAIFIYFIEEHPQFLPLVEPLFGEVNEGRKKLVTSALTLLEVLVVPYRSGDHLLEGDMKLFSHRVAGPCCGDFARHLVPRTAKSFYGSQDAGCFQLVAALAAGCATFLTNDVPSQPYRASVFCN